MVEEIQDPVATAETGGPVVPMAPHRGVVILILGIISLVCCCFICGIIAWVMGKNDLREMDAGKMDPTGRGLTNAGKICGMISVILAIIVIVIQLIAMLLTGGMFLCRSGQM